MRSWKANGLVGTDSGKQWNLKLPACWGKGVRGDKGQETKKPREAPKRELSTSEDVDEVGRVEEGLAESLDRKLTPGSSTPFHTTRQLLIALPKQTKQGLDGTSRKQRIWSKNRRLNIKDPAPSHPTSTMGVKIPTPSSTFPLKHLQCAAKSYSKQKPVTKLKPQPTDSIVRSAFLDSDRKVGQHIDFNNTQLYLSKLHPSTKVKVILFICTWNTPQGKIHWGKGCHKISRIKCK